ncbi:MAG: ribonuclease P protein component [Candidatus Krumholzibacteriia bacterium]
MPDRDRIEWRSLVHKTEFQKVYTEGVKRVGRLLVVYLLTADDLARAVVASRKVGGAVRRNRAKRLLREAHRTGILSRRDEVTGLRARFFPGPAAADPAAERVGGEGLWVVLVARQRIVDATSREVRAELDALLTH